MNTATDLLNSVGAYTTLIARVFCLTFKRPPVWFLIREQMYNIGVLSLAVVAFTGFSTGLVLATQSIFQLADKGMTAITGVMVAKAMVTELGPVLTAFMVTGRIGAAMCAELGTMKVTEQLDALKSMAVNPLQYLVAPRFIAGTCMVPLLTIFSVIMGILGGYLISVFFFDMTSNTFLDPLPEQITHIDVATGLIKSIVFGILIVTIACYKGLCTTGGAEGVGSSTTSSVVITYSCILSVNFLLTLCINTYGAYFL